MPVVAGAVFVAARARARCFVDDPNVAERSQRLAGYFGCQSTDPGTRAPQLYQLNVELNKRITENFGMSLATGYSWLTRPGDKTANGWQNLELGLKYKIYVNPEHEFMLSAGVSREFARTGASGSNGATLDNDDTSSTTPTIFFGKDWLIGCLPAVAAITGSLGYQVVDKVENNR